MTLSLKYIWFVFCIKPTVHNQIETWSTYHLGKFVVFNLTRCMQLMNKKLKMKYFNPNGAEGLIMPTLFSDCCSSQISWLLLIYYKHSENKKNVFFTVTLGDIEGGGTLCPPHSIYIQKPRTNRDNIPGTL